ncbi:MAG: AI-2E family transporter [Planctomycetaceae bacterium]
MAETNLQASQARGVSYLYMAAAFVLVVAGMRAAEPILNPLLLAVFLSVICAPAYFALLKRKVANWLALLIVVSVLSAVMLSVVFVVMESIAGFTSNHRHYEELLQERTRGFRRQIDQLRPGWIRDTDSDPQKPKAEGPPAVADAVGASDGTGESPATPLPEVAGDSASPERSASENPNSEDASAESNADDRPESAEDIAPGPESKSASGEEELPAVFRFPEPERSIPRDQRGWDAYILQQFSPGAAISLAASVAGSIGQMLSNVFLILLTVVFILLEVGTFEVKMHQAFVRKDDVGDRAARIIKSIQHYIVMKTWVSLATGVLITIWLSFLGVRYSVLWGLLAFLFNFIPNIGSFIAAVPAILIAWLELTTLPAIAAAVGFIIINGAIGNFIEPRLMGKGLGLSPLVVFCSMVFWGWVLGPVGMLLSVPLTMTARIALDGFDDTRWLATLLGNVET